jgi:hypothetical protein
MGKPFDEAVISEGKSVYVETVLIFVNNILADKILVNKTMNEEEILSITKSNPKIKDTENSKFFSKIKVGYDVIAGYATVRLEIKI